MGRLGTYWTLARVFFQRMAATFRLLLMKPINPTAPKYTIPAGTLGIVSRWDCSGLRPHRVRNEMHFDRAICFHGPDLPIFKVEGTWLFSAPRSEIVVRDQRVIYALEFLLAENEQLILWPDERGNCDHARPKRQGDTLLDVRAGQEIQWKSGTRVVELVVEGVKLYRCSVHRQNGASIGCGATWLRFGSTAPASADPSKAARKDRDQHASS